MLKHIVFWKLRGDITGQARNEKLVEIKRGFEAMQGKIPGLQRIEIGITFSQGDDSADICLYSEFESRAALERYATDPLHQEMAAVVRDVRTERRVADYEM